VLVLTAISLPFLVWFIPLVYGAVEKYITLLLISVLMLLLLNDKKEKAPASIFIFLSSGAAGLMLFSAFPSDSVLFPALGGLFGLPLVVTSMMQRSSIPPQKSRQRYGKLPLRGCVAGWLAGMFVGILPGTGSAQAGTLANGVLRGRERDFMTALGGINTSNVLFSFIALQALDKTRTGVAAAVQNCVGTVVLTDIIFFMLVAIASCFLAAIFTLEMGKRALGTLARLDYRKVNMSVIIIMAALIYHFTALTGLVTAALCALLGLSCIGLGSRRMYLMGFVMVPTMVYFSALL
jgi:putative membrane protein